MLAAFAAAVLLVGSLVAAPVRPGAAGVAPANAGPIGPDVTPAASPASIRDASLEPVRGRVDPGSAYESTRAPFEVRIDGEPVHFLLTSVLVLPGGSLSIEAPVGMGIRYAAGSILPRGDGRWSWTAPEPPGAYAVRVEGDDGHTVDLVAFVLHPRGRARGGVLGGYRIGSYRDTPLGGRPEYLPPVGFIEVASVDEDIRVSPSVTLGEILCKQPGDPRYATFTPALLDKLETVLEAVNMQGIEVGALTIMSGFRTPWYNRSIGNTTDYSRHLWGDAADIYIDVDGNGDMDDLDGDGRSDLADARVLADVVERVRAAGPAPYVPGGMSLYRRNAAHGPFVHIDARGQAARW